VKITIKFMDWTGKRPLETDTNNLRRADLSGADLSGADLRRADLSGADLRRADLSGADLSGADLRRADLSGADLSGADLSGADLSGAYLSGAYLRMADLKEVKNGKHALAQTSIVPEAGAFIGWKMCKGNILVKVEIPADAKRSNATGRKCRASHVNVLEVFGASEAISNHDGKTIYRAGETVTCDVWCEDRWRECAGGIHFFITKIEAENYL
jgi:hypothetical protein